MAEAMRAVPQYVCEGWTYVHPYGDPLVIAGQGTLGLEILEDLPHVSDVIVSIGGGGLAGGVAMAMRSERPAVRVWGVETEGAETMTRALAAGRVVELPHVSSVARTLCAPAVAEATLLLAQQYLESVTVVSDASALDAQRFLLERAKVLAEPASSCTLAAAERLCGEFGEHVVLVLCGGNADVDALLRGAA
jgi:threonine dehydratase